MRVAFDSRPSRDVRGIGRYSRCLLAALESTRAPGDTLLQTHRPTDCDVFHAPWLDGAMLRCPVPMVVTLHDLVPLKRRSEYLRTGLRFRLNYLAVQRAGRVIVPTAAVAVDAQHELGIPEERVAVVHEAPAPAFRPRAPSEVQSARERHGLPEQYLLWVGGMRTPDPRKRVAALARTRRELPLVLVGPTSAWARELPGAIVTGTVDDEDLAAIYTGAHALVFPSDDEGFGLPPVEALACGTPVAACDVPALREVLGERVTLCEVGDLDGLVRAAEGLRRPAPAAPSWTWEDAARATWDVYRAAREAPRTGPRRSGPRRRRADQS